MEIELLQRGSRHRPLIDVEFQQKQRLTLSWNELSCNINSQGHSTPILNCVSGRAESGEILGVMGPSGSGKTTLLSMLAGNTAGAHESIFVNQTPISGIEYRRVSAYLMQNDDLLSTLTPREALRFSLDMRTLYSAREKTDRVESLIRELALTDIADNLIGGFFDKGVSGGEKKRISIGVQILANPSILILDEPTSGLDSCQASRVMQMLKKEAVSGTTIILSIHQPSMKVYNEIDKLMLLSRGSRVYFGDRQNALDYFESQGFQCPVQTNPPDHFINIVVRSPELCIRHPSSLSSTLEKDTRGLQSIQYPLIPSAWAKFVYLFRRSILSTRRNQMMTMLKLAQTLFLIVLLDTIFHGLSKDRGSFQSINGYLFLVVNTQIMASYENSVIAFQVERSLFIKEKTQGLYGVLEYYMTKSVVEIPILIFSSVLFSVGTYWVVGLNDEIAQKFSIFVATVLLCQFCAVGFAYLTSAMFKTTAGALTGSPMVIGFLVLFGGFFASGNSQPSWSAWLKYLSPFYYAFAIFAINEYSDCVGEVCEDDPLGLLGFEENELWSMVGKMVGLAVVVRGLALMVLMMNSR